MIRKIGGRHTDHTGPMPLDSRGQTKAVLREKCTTSQNYLDRKLTSFPDAYDEF